jgi:hypothetical protein
MMNLSVLIIRVITVMDLHEIDIYSFCDLMVLWLYSQRNLTLLFTIAMISYQ